ncbi:MAG: hypothetical protein C3L25_10770 [Candidatus Sedimenticola endophacoides]|uniref:OmpH family outer membrane protein n=2 Tax=Candidatus Sedimenticola endophacoides TaxID=2548426 RepID=A0A6N4DLM2_9GAMM|nr:MAG: hypothetical protein C3L26_10910 [Candidatus Sedimenticola endophacoides]PUD99803.1 MAG: hypothetical protein C3L24_10205 [Candidatus Sedimenticola endophacoides]PUE02392.1 MAG: hypothetical protein C3L25_10770 [Candidatus Sedimenticola endophacoides]
MGWRFDVKRFVAFLTAAFLMGLAGAALAEGVRIGVVNPNKLVERSPQYDQVRRDLEKEFQQRNQNMLDKQKQLKVLEEKKATDSAVMSDVGLNRLEQDIRSHRRHLNLVKEEFREDLNVRRTEEFNKLLRHVSEVVHQVAREENLDVVLSQGIVFASQRVDLTDRVLERLREQFKAASEKK